MTEKELAQFITELRNLAAQMLTTISQLERAAAQHDATEAQSVSGKTPGQAAYEAYARIAAPHGDPWEDRSRDQREAWEAAAQAAIKAGTATFHDGCAAVIAGLEASRDQLRNLAAEMLSYVNTADMSLPEADQVDEWRNRAGLEAQA